MSRQITISLNILRDFIWGFDQLADITAQSVTAQAEVYFPIIVPKELGNLLNDLNTDNLFHIIQYPTHAEVWHRKHWEDSSSRRWELVRSCNVATEEHNARAELQRQQTTKINRIKELIKTQMRAFAAPGMEGPLLNMALAVSKLSKDQCHLIPGLVDILWTSEPTD